MDLMKMLDKLEEIVRGNREAERLIEDMRSQFEVEIEAAKEEVAEGWESDTEKRLYALREVVHKARKALDEADLDS